MRHDIAPSLLFSLMVSINPAKSIGGDQGATLLGVPASEHLKRENLEQEQDQKGGRLIGCQDSSISSVPEGWAHPSRNGSRHGYSPCRARFRDGPKAGNSRNTRGCTKTNHPSSRGARLRARSAARDRQAWASRQPDSKVPWDHNKPHSRRLSRRKYRRGRDPSTSSRHCLPCLGDHNHSVETNPPVRCPEIHPPRHFDRENRPSSG